MRSWPPGARFNPDLDRLYYVIVGNGFAGLTNHLTLLATGRVRKEFPILHVGGPCPWSVYSPVAMGQWPALLSIPGALGSIRVPEEPDTIQPPDHGFLQSTEFIRRCEAQWRALADRSPFYALNGYVHSLSELPDENIELRVSGLDRPICGYQVDVCGGPGKPLSLDPSVLSNPELISEMETGRRLTGGQPRLITGESWLQEDAAVAAGKRVAVIGGGPTGAWVVEKAESLQCSVLWISEKALAGGFVASRRNDKLAQGPITRSKSGGTWVVDTPLFPSSATTRFAEYISVTSLEPKAECVEVGLAASTRLPAGASPRLVDRSRKLWPAVSEQFDQVVVATGQAKLASQPGSWAAMVDPLLAKARARHKHLIRDRAGRVIGLANASGRLRVLGSAALVHPEVSAEWRRPNTRSNFFMHSLAEQARVDTGMTLAGLTIAEANGYFAERRNKNLNTATYSDIKAACSNLDSVLLRSWEEMRSVRIHPFTEVEFYSVRTAMTDCY